ncbi:unnamed protein product, partial [Amoebophrya sp. A25]
SHSDLQPIVFFCRQTLMPTAPWDLDVLQKRVIPDIHYNPDSSTPPSSTEIEKGSTSIEEGKKVLADKPTTVGRSLPKSEIEKDKPNKSSGADKSKICGSRNGCGIV